ncbi:MAG: hypothetical protein ACETWK_12860 [Candidatus Aminicenantaceae bacterium]
MKIKCLALGLICLFLSFCASSLQVKSQKPYRELRVYENVTFDHTWRSCKDALESRGYKIEDANKNEGYIHARWEYKKAIHLIEDRPSYAPLESVKLSFFISMINGKVSLLCKVYGRDKYYAVNKEEAKKIFNAVDKYLIKK